MAKLDPKTFIKTFLCEENISVILPKSHLWCNYNANKEPINSKTGSRASSANEKMVNF